MSQIGSPQKNILEPMAGGYPSTTPAAAGESALLLGQTLVDDANQQTGGLPIDDLTRSVEQPDLPELNTQHKTMVPNASVDANGNHIVDSDAVFASGTTGGPFDAAQAARERATDEGIDPALVENATVLGQPKTTGFGAGYGAFSGGTPGGAATAAKVIQDLTYTAKMPGLQGGAVTIAYIAGGTAGAEVVSVSGLAISVSMATTVSTATQIRAAILASSDASSLVSVIVSGTGSNAQVAAAAAHLLGGTNTPSDGDGALTNSKGSFAAINRSGSRNHAMLNVIHRPGDNQAAFLF